MTNYAAGHTAEQAAVEFLKAQGFNVLDVNWRTKYCEIDIVSVKNKTIYFIEVKYRKNNTFGTGFDYITPKKLNQMKFAAEMWVSNNAWKGDYQLGAIELRGEQQITQFLTDL